jgi:hypothetical protein
VFAEDGKFKDAEVAILEGIGLGKVRKDRSDE